MLSTIIKVRRIPEINNHLWLSVIRELQDNKFKVQKNFNIKSDLNIVLSGMYENPRGYTGKRVMMLDRKEWNTRGVPSWGCMYRDIVKHYYDDIVDVTDKTPKEIVQTIKDYIHAEERKADKS